MKNINTTTIILAMVTLATGLLLGWFLFGGSNEVSTQEHDHNSMVELETVWTCSMHPQIRKNEAGDCPICGMDLIPLETDDTETDPLAVSMSATAIQLAQIQTIIVATNSAAKSTRLTGKVQADERLLFTQSSHIPGRIEKLLINFTGDFVTQGKVIAYVYSPDLVTAQQELLEAKKIMDSQPELFIAAKQKLKNWKLTEQQIEDIITSGKTMELFPIMANVSGYVTKKLVNLGDYIKQGQAIYEIVDLSKVWIQFDVYESEMNWIKKGAKVSYTIQSVPGKTFNGTISYIDPIIDPKTRVAKARVEVSNKGLILKPEMFATGTVENRMNIKPSTITIPKTAVMWTGKRSVVYVMQNATQGVSFIMREVTLGSEQGDHYVIESGLEAGEEIAVNGTFSIDAAAQLAGKPSMMNPKGGVAKIGHNHSGNTTQEKSTEGQLTNTPTASTGSPISDEAKTAIEPLFTAYFDMKAALADDEFEKAKKAGVAMKTSLDKINMKLFTGNAHEVWMQQSTALNKSLEHIEHFEDIKEFRTNFMEISTSVIVLAESFRPISTTVYIQHCPMADSNKGADWLSLDKQILNPYFGSSMLKCGKTLKTLD